MNPYVLFNSLFYIWKLPSGVVGSKNDSWMLNRVSQNCPCDVVMLEWNLVAAPVQHRVENHRPMNLFWGCISPYHAFQTVSAHDLIFSICSVVPCFPSQGLNCGCWMMVFACFLQCWSMQKGVGYLKAQAQQVGLERLFLKDIFGMWWLDLCISINM